MGRETFSKYQDPWELGVVNGVGVAMARLLEIRDSWHVHSKKVVFSSCSGRDYARLQRVSKIAEREVRSGIKKKKRKKSLRNPSWGPESRQKRGEWGYFSTQKHALQSPEKLGCRKERSVTAT